MKIEWDKIGARAYTVFAVIVVLAVPVGLAYMGLGLIGLVIAIPIFAWFAARFLVHGSEGLLTWVSRKQLEEWQGAYYAFNDVQVRVYEDDTGALWFVAKDVTKAVGLRSIPRSFEMAHPKDIGLVPGTRLKALKPEGLERMLGKRNERDAISFLVWMRREVVGPWEKRKR